MRFAVILQVTLETSATSADNAADAMKAGRELARDIRGTLVANHFAVREVAVREVSCA